jgi:hypothetical protein
MKPLAALAFACVATSPAAVPLIRLPALPRPPVSSDGGMPREIGSVRLLVDLQRSGLHGFDNLDTADSDYVLLSSASLTVLAGWLEGTCTGLGFDLPHARAAAYDGSVFARLAGVATSLAELHASNRPLAIPIGLLVCRRNSAWGELPADRTTDAYIIVDTDDGMLVYDPPTRQFSALADFPNKDAIVQIRF